MIPRSLAEVSRLIGGRLVLGTGGTEKSRVTGASTDSRSTAAGDLFFAIRGERDGLDFAPAAVAAGAVGCVVPLGAGTPTGATRIEVEDPREALGRLAAAVRRDERDHLPAIAVTGSVGKTTTCGYLATLLETIGPTHRPPSSFNNDLGVPLTILGAPEGTRALIIEIGTNAPGEVAALAAWTEARVGVVTAIEAAHLEGLGSLAGVAREKLSLLAALPDASVGWVPTPHLEAARAFGRTVRTFGPGGDSEVIPLGGAHHRWRCDEVDLEFEWPGALRHQRLLLSAALGAGRSLGARPEAMLERVSELRDPPLRGEVRRHGGVDLLLDCYNANPAALEAAIERLEEEPAEGRRICVIGTMEELGPEEADFHRRVGRRLGRSTVEEVFLVGRGRDWYREGLREAGQDGEPVEIDDAAAHRIADSLRPGDRVLFKASRREALETLAERVARCLVEREGS